MGLGIKQFKGLTSGVKVSPWDAASEFLNQLDQATTQASLDSINTVTADTATAVSAVAADQAILGGKIDAVQSSITGGVGGMTAGDLTNAMAFEQLPGAGTGPDAITWGEALLLAGRAGQMSQYTWHLMAYTQHFVINAGDFNAIEAAGPGGEIAAVDPKDQLSTETELEFLERVAPSTTWIQVGTYVQGRVDDAFTGNHYFVRYRPYVAGMALSQFLEAVRYTPSAGADRNALTDALVMLPDALISMGWSGHV